MYSAGFSWWCFLFSPEEIDDQTRPDQRVVRVDYSSIHSSTHTFQSQVLSFSFFLSLSSPLISLSYSHWHMLMNWSYPSVRPSVWELLNRYMFKMLMFSLLEIRRWKSTRQCNSQLFNLTDFIILTGFQNVCSRWKTSYSLMQFQRRNY